MNYVIKYMCLYVWNSNKLGLYSVDRPIVELLIITYLFIYTLIIIYYWLVLSLFIFIET